MNRTLLGGIYEDLLSVELERKLQLLDSALRPKLAPLTEDVSARRLSEYFRSLLHTALTATTDEALGVSDQVALVNDLVRHLGALLERHAVPNARSDAGLVRDQLLLALLRDDPVAGLEELPRPFLPLTETHLLINARDERSVGNELSLEIASADRVDLICSFLFWAGYRQLEPALRSLLRRVGGQLRVLTTVYTGSTEVRVLDELHALGAQIKVSFDTRSTRLHAKAWLLHRNSGHDTAYVGSSNLSASALTTGLEWNVRIGADSALVLAKFRSAFETYWNDPSFETYDPQRDRERLILALSTQSSDKPGESFQFEVRPYPFQAAMLEALDAERFAHGRFRNLLVAATGTGKTVLAAFDYARNRKRFFQEHGRWPKLLFVAHRKELLKQARGTYRAILQDANFGQLLVDGERPDSSDFLFASVQSLSRVEPSSVPKDRWDWVVIDEFHHAEARSYERWLSHLDPWVLLGMTATPERGDGKDVRDWFGGSAAVELRLWDAIDQGHLVPFQYFGLRDPIDLATYWKRGRFDLEQLDTVLTGHHARAESVLRAVAHHVADPSQMRAVGFCVGRGHAKFMAEYFSQKGLPSATALGDDDDRENRIQRLRSGELKVLFTVDALSEGVDIPELDTVLMLRPTESSTVFLQQLGRGLRHSAGKRCLTVLDLVATPDREFRVERRFMVLTGGSRRQIERQVQEGFPYLPAGCAVQLTDDARKIVLASLRESLSNRRSVVVRAIKDLGPNATIQQILAETGIELGAIYRARCLTQLRRDAGFDLGIKPPTEDVLGRGVARLVTLDDPTMLLQLSQHCRADTPPSPTIEWRMVLATMFPNKDPNEAMVELWTHRAIVRELVDLFAYLSTRGDFQPIGDDRFPLKLHCHYKQEQLLTALTGDTEKPVLRSQAGVLPVRGGTLDLLFVTVTKSIERYSPTTMYKDYPLSLDRFHWQSMATTTVESKRGERHIRHRELGVTPLLFVRHLPEDEFGETAPYLFLGPVECESFEGERPISVVWKLERPMPVAFFERTRVVA